MTLVAVAAGRRRLPGPAARRGGGAAADGAAALRLGGAAGRAGSRRDGGAGGLGGSAAVAAVRGLGARRQRDLVERPAPALRGSGTAACGRRRRWAGTRGTGRASAWSMRPLSQVVVVDLEAGVGRPRRPRNTTRWSSTHDASWTGSSPVRQRRQQPAVARVDHARCGTAGRRSGVATIRVPSGENARVGDVTRRAARARSRAPRRWRCRARPDRGGRRRRARTRSGGRRG